MGHPYWPLFDVEVRTPRVTLRYIDDELGCALMDVARRGIHDPSWMPFGMAWTDVPSPQFERNAFQFWWRCRANTTPTSWNVNFAVIVDGQVMGATGLFADDFPTLRAFETGSWLGREFQGQGVGTEMRIATVQFGFEALDAQWATTGAFADNGASLGVTNKLGYTPNGAKFITRRGEASQTLLYRMDRAHWEEHVRRDDIEIVGADGARDVLGLA